MHSKNSKWRGFTVVELLVVISMAGLMTTLMTPAIQDARDIARKRVCQTNMKKVALALHNYHDTFRTFPPGWVMAYGDAASHSAYGWQAALLPYVEQAPLYNKLDYNQPFEAPNEFTSLAVEHFQCPSSAAAATNQYRGGYGNSNYSGNYGSRPIPRWTTGRMEAFWPGGAEVVSAGRDFAPQYGKSASDSNGPPGAVTASGSPEQRTQKGIFRWNSRTQMQEITDGTSNTLLFGERSNRSGNGLWIGLQSNRYEDDAVTDASYWSPLNASPTGYSSEHPGGVHVALCDGSVRFLANEIDSRPDRGVLQNLADIDDNQVIPPSVFAEEF